MLRNLMQRQGTSTRRNFPGYLKISLPEQSVTSKRLGGFQSLQLQGLADRLLLTIIPQDRQQVLNEQSAVKDLLTFLSALVLTPPE